MKSEKGREKPMFEELIKYWEKANITFCNNAKTQIIHPCDEGKLRSISNNNDYELKTDLFPEPYNGNLSDPKIVFLFLNPGFNERDYKVHECPKMREEFKRSLYQEYTKEDEYPFFWLNPEYNKVNEDKTRQDAENPGAYYWNKLFDQKDKKKSFLHCIANHKNEYETRKRIAQNICDIEMFPYHSKKFSLSWAGSQSATIAKKAVIEAINGKSDTLFVFMRSFKLWIPDEAEQERIKAMDNVFINPCPRNPTLNPHITGGVGKKIMKWIQDQNLI